MTARTVTLIALAILLLATALVYASQSKAWVVGVKVDGVITQATYETIKGAIDLATREGRPLLIVINTPGGSLDATKDIVEALLNAEIPVIVYVYPKGATAWSAGSLILMASHVAAMSPGSVVGSAQPVAYSPLTGSEPVTEPKILNAVAEYAEQIARARGRNATAARMFVTENLNLGPEEALEEGVVDLMAENLVDLLLKLDGLLIEVDGKLYELRTAEAGIEWYGGGLRTEVLSVLADPLIASILFLAGLYGLIFGLAYGQPAPAVVGAFLVVLSLAGMGFEVNLVSVLLVILGSLLLIVELFVTPGFGVVGVTGVIMLILGALLSPMSVDPSKWAIHPEWYSKLSLMMTLAVLPLAAFASMATYKVIKAKRAKPKLHLTDMVGAEGVALDEIGPGKEGFVRCLGEYWLAESSDEIKPGDKVVVVDKEGIKLKVRRKEVEG
ncbi:MAG: nodulation protein NfeD [Thermoprotei archaeon]|nr:MAG: nodulation protein NfeD [Thermoprotei archaeon]